MAEDVRVVEGESSCATILRGDVTEVLETLPDGCVHCVVTSPPYYGLRDYKTGDAQVGLEATPQEYVRRLVSVFREVRRVLRDDGVVWLNLGDSYAGVGKSGGGDQGERWEGEGHATHRGKRGGRWAAPPDGLKAGDLIGVPWRVAFALQEDGWWLRKDNVWSKSNPMPESVNGWRWERCRTKQATSRTKQATNQKSVDAGLAGGLTVAEWVDCSGCPKCSPNSGYVLRRASWRCTSAHEYVFQLTKSGKYFCDAEAAKEPSTDMSGGTRNPRSVWNISTRPFPGAHFAVFPSELPERCIRVSTSERGVCAECGAPWAPVVERAPEPLHVTGFYPTCECDSSAPPVPATVLDPFLGSGTTALVALRLGRDAIGIDLSDDYCELAEKRIRDDVDKSRERERKKS